MVAYPGVSPAFAPTGLTGAVAASRYAGGTTSGKPVTGTFSTGDFVIDQTGLVWICTAGGSPGTWLSAAQISNSSGSAPVLTPTLSSGVAAQLADTTRDYMVYMNITTSGTVTHIEIGPTNTPANTFLASASVTAGAVYSFRLPAGWWIKWTGTTTALATLAIGC